ncbi:SDR family oxidoreductase [bacterium]|nr:SDR family oxidoreductase [bacterium]
MIIITGASRGIGNYIFNYFLEKDDAVIGIYNKTKPKSHLSNFVCIDLTDQNAIEKFIYSLSLKDVVLINAAGVSFAAIAHKQSIQQFKDTLELNSVASFTLIKKLLPIMRKQNYGRIINISSVVPQIGTPGNVAYAASKAALWGMSKVIAIENATKGITSNCLNLGYCNIGMIETIPHDILKRIIETIPLKRLCEPHNITNAIEFLIASEYVTGTEININGGMY